MTIQEYIKKNPGKYDALLKECQEESLLHENDESDQTVEHLEDYFDKFFTYLSKNPQILKEMFNN